MPDSSAATQPIATHSRKIDTASIASQHIAKMENRANFRPGLSVKKQEFTMLHYAVVFFVIALIAAVFGFGGIAASAVGIGKILFIVFAILAVASFLFGLIKKS